MHQKEKIALEITAKIASVNNTVNIGNKKTDILILFYFILFYNLCHMTGLTHRASCSFTGNLLMQY
jgi:hypothetical protein